MAEKLKKNNVEMSEKTKKGTHPLFLLTTFLNDNCKKVTDTQIFKHKVFEYLKDFHDLVTIYDDKYIMCKGTKKLTKDTCIVYIRKNIDLQEAFEMSDKTYDITKESGAWCKVLIVQDLTEAMKNRLLQHMSTDYIRYDFKNKEWVNSYKRSLKFINRHRQI